ncbi:MAG TPA: alpha/beta fold hydrolase [Jiangellales bacterium]|nr:alpha/beta fold hydrolase [Jiangellales bacterium]
MRTREVETADGITLEVRDSGPGPAETVLLLHGFPQDSSAWDRVVPPLRGAGYRVLAPDQRGYSPGARPSGRRAYGLGRLVGDALGVLDDAGVDRAHVVGHDWGGGVAWALAGRHPDRLASVTVLSTPHPAAMRAAMRGSQGLRSAYMLAAQVPVVPDLALGAFGARPLRTVLEASGLPAPVARHYAARMAEPGALTGALGWYRAIPGDRTSAGRCGVPALYVWGARDPALGRRAAEGTEAFVTGPYRFEVLPSAGHWLPETAADEVVPPLLEHLAAYPA